MLPNPSETPKPMFNAYRSISFISQKAVFSAPREETIGCCHAREESFSGGSRVSSRGGECLFLSSSSSPLSSAESPKDRSLTLLPAFSSFSFSPVPAAPWCDSKKSPEIMRYRSRCLLSAGIHSALFALLWSSAMVLCAEKKIPIAPPPEMTEGDVPWLMEAVFEPNRLHVSQASLEKFQKYRKLTCRDGGSNAHRLDQEEYLHQYLEWEQVEFNRALRDTIMKNEKNLNSPEGFEVLKTASETMLDTHFTSKCLPTGESIAGQQQKMTTEIRERTLFEDVLINKLLYLSPSSSLVSSLHAQDHTPS
ncbi:hypothetical protein L596_001711 [Steinernema carpocapsae]|uniref:Uncharacterized protein n=1 Tax=Steinernema carpocapsae TaxID=34508 RepID=A0A4U8UP33_STECR|nr:hypothetical protein L596_001711 [Steinernema carpocapsae]